MNNIFKLHGLPRDIYTERGSTLQNFHIIISVNEFTKETPFFINYRFHPSMDEFFLLSQMDTNLKYIKKCKY